MGINNIIQNAQRVNWNITDDFGFTFNNNKFPLKNLDINGLRPQEILDICTMNIDMPQLTADVEAVLQGGEYRLNAKKFSNFTFSVTFRDVLGLKLRDYFIMIWMKTQTEYFDDIKSSVEVRTQKELIFKSSDVLIANVSQVQFDNANTQVSEFTVEFQAPFYSNSDRTDFGSFGQHGYK